MSSFTDNEDVDLTPWLNKTLLEETLRSGKDDHLKVTSYDVKTAASECDNYASELYRVSVGYSRNGGMETTSLIVKVIPRKQELAEIIIKTDVFSRETTALSSVLPKIYSQLEGAAMSQFEPFSPKHFHSHSSPELIVMEDLVEKGFRMAERSTGLDMEHSLLVMRKIARLHASSAVLHKKHPEVFHPLYENVFREYFREFLQNYVGNAMKRFATEVESWPEYKDSFAVKLHNLADKSTDTLIKSLRRDDNELNVFRHGDLSMKNMMFLYSDTGSIEDVRFVDYQLCHFGSPATDLHYFIHTSVSTDLVNRHHELVQEYHKTLTETFSLLGYQHLSPSLAQLEKQLNNKSEYAMIVCCTVLPLVLPDPDYIPDMGKVLTSENPLHFSEQCKEIMKKHLCQFERKGWL